MTPAERERLFRLARARIVREHTGLMRGTRDDLVRLLRESERAIIALIAAQPTEYERWLLPQLQREVRRTLLEEFGEQAGARISSAAGQAWELGADLVDAPLEAAGVRIAAVVPQISTTQLRAMRAFMVDRVRDIGTVSANKITAELGLVLIGARSPSEAIGAVKQILGASSRDRATTIVRTELGRAFSHAAQERMTAAAERVPGLKKRWRRSAKLHPRLHHALADGQVREVHEPFVLKKLGGDVKLMYPLDPKAPASETINCGCRSEPFIEDWDTVQRVTLRDVGSPQDDSVSVGDLLDRPRAAA